MAGPKRHSADWYALSMLDAILTSGQSSRLQLNLVKGKQSVLQFESNLGWPFESPQDYKDPNVYAAFLVYKPNFTAQQIVEQYQAEVDRLANEGVDAKELERVKSVMRFSKASTLQSAMERARLLGLYELLDGNPAMFDTDYTESFKVTSAQIQAAAKKYLTAARRDVMAIQPAPAAPATGDAK